MALVSLKFAQASRLDTILRLAYRLNLNLDGCVVGRQLHEVSLRPAMTQVIVGVVTTIEYTSFAHLLGRLLTLEVVQIAGRLLLGNSVSVGPAFCTSSPEVLLHPQTGSRCDKYGAGRELGDGVVLPKRCSAIVEKTCAQCPASSRAHEHKVCSRRTQLNARPMQLLEKLWQKGSQMWISVREYGSCVFRTAGLQNVAFHVAAHEAPGLVAVVTSYKLASGLQ